MDMYCVDITMAGLVRAGREGHRAVLEGEHVVSRHAEASTGPITPDRIRTILARVNEGFYDRPEQQREIAQRLMPDLRQLSTG